METWEDFLLWPHPCCLAGELISKERSQIQNKIFEVPAHLIPDLHPHGSRCCFQLIRVQYVNGGHESIGNEGPLSKDYFRNNLEKKKDSHNSDFGFRNLKESIFSTYIFNDKDS